MIELYLICRRTLLNIDKVHAANIHLTKIETPTIPLRR